MKNVSQSPTRASCSIITWAGSPVICACLASIRSTIATLVDAELAETAVRTGRILLTRDRRLLMRKQLDRGYLVRTIKAQEQVLEVIRRYHLHDLVQPFQRCLTCNSPLVTVDKAEILERLQPLTRRYFDEFVFCPVCESGFLEGFTLRAHACLH